jgi:carboxylate-amine ligase
MDMRTVGVEEELMLIDPDSGRLSQSSHRAIVANREASTKLAIHDTSTRETVEQELFLSQLETNSQPSSTLAELRASLMRGRRDAIEAAHAVDCAAVAVATPVLGFARDDQTATRKPRYQHIVDEYADMSALVCGMHIHVAVDGEEAVAVLDRLRPWLPVILAISVNSPFNAGRDTGHASWRSQIWGRCPTSGPAEPFGDLDGYRKATQALIDTGAALDPGMLYLDARISERYPTVEIRVADVCTDLDDVVLIAGLCRALVTTVAEQTRRGEPVPQWRSDVLRAARWRAARYGMSRNLIHPLHRGQARPREVSAAFVDFVADALDQTGDRDEVSELVERLFSHGTGATRQRSVAESAGSLDAVVKDLRERTEASVIE